MRPILTAANLSKSYPGVKALDTVSIEIYPGEVHAVIGENGAGKSTLMAILSGFVTPDQGSGTLDGEQLPFGRASEVRAKGLELVHQHFMLVRNFRVDENLALAGTGKYDPHQTASGIGTLASELGWQIDFSAKIAQLPVGAQQRVEILKALSNRPKILILDEPTAVLAPDEVSNLLDVIRQLRAKGVAVVLIAHKISEVMAVADRVTVLRSGRVVGSVLAAETDQAQLARMMVGDPVASKPKSTRQPGGVGLSVTRLCVKGDRGNVAVNDVTLSVASGEILGIGGVDGNGQVELAEALAGVRPIQSGSLERHGELAYIPQDRRSDGLAVELSIKENLALAALTDSHLSRGPMMLWKQIALWADNLVEQYQVKAPTSDVAASALSGGNQQKVVVARALAGDPKILIAVNPTRGLDIRAADFVHEQVSAAADRGAAVVLVSTDLDELDSLSDRKVFMSKGALSDTLVGSLQ